MITRVNTFDVSIQVAKEAHFGAIESLINANFPNDPPIDKKSIASCIANGGHFLVAVAPHGVVGCVRLDQERCGLFHLTVAPDVRRQGLGALLVAATEDCARQLGWPHVRLGIHESTPGLVTYYEKLGYRLAGEKVASVLSKAGGTNLVAV